MPNGVVFVREVAVQETDLAFVRNHRAPAACHRKPTAENIKDHIIIVVPAFDAVAVFGEKPAAGSDIIQHVARKVRRGVDKHFRAGDNAGIVTTHKPYLQKNGLFGISYKIVYHWRAELSMEPDSCKKTRIQQVCYSRKQNCLFPNIQKAGKMFIKDIKTAKTKDLMAVLMPEIGL
jgi:hypothetical protein